ncbi:MAG: serine/threonine protein kinase, partial [Myxococcales bacterium]
MRVRSRLLLLGALLASGISGAQESPPPDPQRLKDAAEAFDEASKSFQSGRFEDAARRFEDADRLAPSPAALSNALKARRSARQGAAAVTLAAAALERYPDDRGLATLAQAVMKESDRYHRLQVRCAPACVLSLDGKLLGGGDATPGSVIYLEPGNHALSAGWSAGRTRSAKVDAVKGGNSESSLEAPALPPPAASSSGAPVAPAPTTPASPASAPPAASSGAVTVAPATGLSPWFVLAGAGATVVFGGLAIWSGLDTQNNPGPDRVREACAGQSRDCSLFQDGKSKETRTNILFAVTGVVGVATGVVAIFTDWSAPPIGKKATEVARPRTTPWVAPATGGVALGVNGVFLTPCRDRSDPSLLLRGGAAGRLKARRAMTTEQSAVMRRQMLDRYELVAEIASGGMATVYLGRLASGGVERLVAIKKLHPHLERQQDFVEMFLDEARIAARIHHPNVVSTLEFGATPTGHFLVMDYVEGPTLAKLLAKAASTGNAIPPPVSYRIILDTLAGLQIAHDLTSEEGVPLDVVHRDVSPQNVLVGVDGTARITDFGVARAAERLAVTRTGQLKGKLSYMAPEQAKGEPTDRRADVFAMGILLWECLAGRRLFRGKSDSEAETLSKVLYGDIARLSSVIDDIDPVIDDICARALARPLDERYPSCAAFMEDLEQAAREGRIQIGSARDVARHVESAYGHELAQRRAAIRQSTAPSGEMSDALTSNEGLRHLSSVSSAALSVDPPSSLSSSMPRAVPIPP